MSLLGTIKKCRWCGHEIILWLFVGWQHVNVIHGIDCDAEPEA